MLVKNAQESIGSLLDATTDGSLFTQNLAEVDELILMNDPNITNPHGEEQIERRSKIHILSTCCRTLCCYGLQ